MTKEIHNLGFIAYLIVFENKEPVGSITKKNGAKFEFKDTKELKEMKAKYYKNGFKRYNDKLRELAPIFKATK